MGSRCGFPDNHLSLNVVGSYYELEEFNGQTAERLTKDPTKPLLSRLIICPFRVMVQYIMKAGYSQDNQNHLQRPSIVLNIMVGLHSSLLVICATLVAISNADLIYDLTQQNFTVHSLGQNSYADDSTACKSFYVIRH